MANMLSKGIILIGYSLFIWEPWLSFYLFASMEPGTRNRLTSGGIKNILGGLGIIETKD
jgi:hypothetical protein